MCEGQPGCPAPLPQGIDFCNTKCKPQIWSFQILDLNVLFVCTVHCFTARSAGMQMVSVLAHIMRGKEFAVHVCVHLTVHRVCSHLLCPMEHGNMGTILCVQAKKKGRRRNLLSPDKQRQTTTNNVVDFFGRTRFEHREGGVVRNEFMMNRNKF